MFRKRQWHHIVPPQWRADGGSWRSEEGAQDKKEEQALTAHLLSPAMSRRWCSTQDFRRKEKDGKRRGRRKERMQWRRGGRWLALSGGLKTFLTEQEKDDKGQIGHDRVYMWRVGRLWLREKTNLNTQSCFLGQLEGFNCDHCYWGCRLDCVKMTKELFFLVCAHQLLLLNCHQHRAWFFLKLNGLDLL